MVRHGDTQVRPGPIRAIRNDWPDAAPAQAIMEETGTLSHMPVFMGTVPTRSSISRFVILLDALASGQQGPCAADGIAWVTVCLKPGETLQARDHVRPHRGQWYGRKFRNGPLRVEAVIGAIENDGEEDVLTSALVTFVGWDGGQVYVTDNGDSVTGAFRTLICGRGYSVDLATTPGEAAVGTVEETE